MANFEVGDIVSIISSITGEVMVKGCLVDGIETRNGNTFVRVVRADWGRTESYLDRWCRLERKAPPPTAMDKMVEALTRLHEDQEDLKNLLSEIHRTLCEMKREMSK
jgi:hypothetical protein